jgi:pseudoazurin
MKMQLRRPALRAALFAVTLLSAGAQAAEHQIKMLNAGATGPMVFEPDYVRAAPGDTIVFVPTQIGAHFSNSILLPDGAKPWRGEVDKELRVKLDKEGVYLYVCEPHKAMGMVGVIQVGKPHNLAAATARAKAEAAGFALGKDRFDKALAKVK